MKIGWKVNIFKTSNAFVSLRFAKRYMLKKEGSESNYNLNFDSKHPFPYKSTGKQHYGNLEYVIKKYIPVLVTHFYMGDGQGIFMQDNLAFITCIFACSHVCTTDLMSYPYHFLTAHTGKLEEHARMMFGHSVEFM